MPSDFSQQCKEALRLLAQSRNVLVSGAPGTGKSRLLSEVALAFAARPSQTVRGGPPVHDAGGRIPIPPSAGTSDTGFPARNKTNRQVFRTVFHQNSKHRDFLSGYAPAVVKKAGEADFRIIKGTLYRASEHAKTPDGASLLIIDEINRGPAVQVFGGAIGAMEADKRLAPDGSKRAETQFFELMDPATGEIIEYALPHDLYILAAMNQADTSVEPLDVAFLRRWEPMRLEPDLAAVRAFYGLAEDNEPLPEVPTDANHIFEASVRAWQAVNVQISMGRGPEFQIGHGVLISVPKPTSTTLEEAKAFVSVGWAKIRAHVEEVFFGDVRGVAATLNALDGPPYNPFKLIETTFADDLRFKLEGPIALSANDIYPALRAFSAQRE